MSEDETLDILWENEEEWISDLGEKVPPWIDQDLNAGQLAAICQGGCESGAYMPAVTYHEASHTMERYGDDVLDFLEQNYYEIKVPEETSWSGIAVHFLSMAVEAWAWNVLDSVREALENMETEEEDEE